MNTKELRIGNLIDCEYGISIVENIYCDAIEVIITGEDFVREVANDNINPIPLTEEMLLKAGFEVFYKSVYFINYKNEIDFTISYCRKTTNYYNHKEGVYYYGDDSIEIKYVHQLQNLYFCLTGKEVNFNL